VLKRRPAADEGKVMEPMLAVTAVVTGVGSLFGLLFAVQVRAREIADAHRRELHEGLRG
jgi:hypothetical protein